MIAIGPQQFFASLSSVSARPERIEVNAKIPVFAEISRLTSKQREVLDLLLDHKTSKEIAQILGISPHTVDQRIQFAKRTLGVSARSDLARVYRDLRNSCEQFTHQESHMAVAQDRPPSFRLDESEAINDPNRPNQGATGSEMTGYSLVPELFEGQQGKWVRFISILSITFLVLLITLGGLAAYASLSSLLSE